MRRAEAGFRASSRLHRMKMKTSLYCPFLMYNSTLSIIDLCYDMLLYEFYPVYSKFCLVSTV